MKTLIIHTTLIIILITLLNSCKEESEPLPFIAPSSKNVWKMGTNEKIKWRSDVGNIKNLNKISIFLYKEGDANENYYEIIQTDWRNGSEEFHWYIDPILNSQTHCYIKIADDYKNEGNQSEVFTITSSSLPYSFVSPAQTDILKHNSEHIIRWTRPPESENKQITIDLYKIINEKPIIYKKIIENTQNDEECPWLIEVDKTGKYKLKISTLEQDASGISNTFTINKPEVPNFTQPDAQTIWNENEKQDIIWEKQNWGLVDIYLYKQGNTGGNYEKNIADDAEDNGSFSNWLVNANLQENQNGVFYIKIIPYNETTSSNGIKSENFTINGK